MLSPEAVDLLSCIIVPEEERPTIHQVLEHPWFTDDQVQKKLEEQCGESADAWKVAQEMLDLQGVEPVHYDCGDWIAYATGVGSDYVLSKSAFKKAYLSYHPGTEISDMSSDEKQLYPNWKAASKRGMKLYYRNPACSQSMVLVTAAWIEQLHSRFENQVAKYVCDPAYPQRAGTCRVSGKLPTNREVAEFLVQKTGLSVVDGKLEFSASAEWQSTLMLKKAVFAREADIPGKMANTRALHDHIPGCTRAFAFSG